jgi:hypothetical protein
MNKNQNLSTREQLQQKFNTSRMNLLLMMVLTVVNVVLFFTGSDSMMLFSASIPYFAVIFGATIEIPSMSMICYAIAALTILGYLIFWLLSKKRYGWLIPALVLFIMDTLAMGGMYIWFADFSGILDILMHVWVLYYLFVGISSGKKLKNLPAEENAVVEEVRQPVDPEHWAE